MTKRLLLLVSICACTGVPLPPPTDPLGAAIEAPIMLGMAAVGEANHEHAQGHLWIGRNVHIDGVHVRWQRCDSIDLCEEAIDEAPVSDLVGIEAIENDAGAELQHLRFKVDSSTEKRLELYVRTGRSIH